MSSPSPGQRGSQQPRVANFPPYPISAAPEVIALARKAGLHLDEWQQYVLTHGLGQELVDGELGDWTAKRVSTWVPRQNGKGGIIEALELGWMFLPGFEVDLIIHSAHEHKTSKKAYERMEKLIKRTPSMARRVQTFRQANGERMIVLKDGRLLEYHTRSETGVRGFSAPRIILDEAQELTEDQVAAIMPTVSAMPNWQVWFFGTPPRSPEAWVYNLKEDGEAGAPDLAHFDWGSDLDPTKPEHRDRMADPAEWLRCNPAAPHRITMKTMQGEFRPSGLGSKFGQERLGIWQPRKVGGGAVDPKQWAAIADPSSRREGDIALAVDISTMRDWAAIAVYGRREDGLGHLQLVDYRPGTDWIADRLAELKNDHDPVGIGMGRGTYNSLKEALNAAGMYSPDDLPDEIAEQRGDTDPRRGDLLVTNPGTMAAATGQFVDAVRQASMRVVPAIQLDESIAGVAVRVNGNTMAWSAKDSKADVSPTGSATVARYTYLTRLDAPRELAYITPSAFHI